MPLVPSATLLVAVLAELDVTLSKPPPAQAETRPDATVAPKLNHLLPEPEALAQALQTRQTTRR